MKKINFNIAAGTAIVVDVEMKVFKEDEECYNIIIEQSMDEIEISSQGCLIEIKNIDGEVEAAANDILVFENLEPRNHFIVITKNEDDNITYKSIHPLKLVQHCRDINLVGIALNKGYCDNPRIKLLNEIINLKDEKMIQDCKDLLESKRKLISLTNVSNIFKQLVFIGLNNPIIWSKLPYYTICKYLKATDFRKGEGYIITNKKIKAIPSNIVIMDNHSEILETYISEGKVYFDILNKHGLAT